ncbi:hypothetical protein PG990_011448 [Apiospora arundinis]
MDDNDREEGTSSYSLKPWFQQHHKASKASRSNDDAQAAVVAAGATTTTTTTTTMIRTRTSSHSSSIAVPPPPYIYMTSLPMELQLEILSHVDLPGLVQLRRTSRLYRSVLITRGYLVRRFFIPGDRAGIYSISSLKYCCSHCLTMPPASRLLVPPRDVNDIPDDIDNDNLEELHGWWSWDTLCYRCWRKRLAPPSKCRAGQVLYQVENGFSLYICQFCGWPIRKYTPMHKGCDTRRFWMRFVWFLLGVVQFAAGVFGAIAAWGVYEDDPRIKIPSSINFGLLFVSWITVGFHLGFKEGFYKWPLALEFVQAVLWLPPLIANAQWKCDPYFRVCDPFPRFSLAAFAVSL